MPSRQLMVSATSRMRGVVCRSINPIGIKSRAVDTSLVSRRNEPKAVPDGKYPGVRPQKVGMTTMPRRWFTAGASAAVPMRRERLIAAIAMIIYSKVTGSRRLRLAAFTTLVQPGAGHQWRRRREQQHRAASRHYRLAARLLPLRYRPGDEKAAAPAWHPTQPVLGVARRSIEPRAAQNWRRP